MFAEKTIVFAYLLLFLYIVDDVDVDYFLNVSLLLYWLTDYYLYVD